MRRSILATAQFKPPRRSINMSSASTTTTSAGVDDDDDGGVDLEPEQCERSKRVKISISHESEMEEKEPGLVSIVSSTHGPGASQSQNRDSSENNGVPRQDNDIDTSKLSNGTEAAHLKPHSSCPAENQHTPTLIPNEIALSKLSPLAPSSTPPTNQCNQSTSSQTPVFSEGEENVSHARPLPPQGNFSRLMCDSYKTPTAMVQLSQPKDTESVETLVAQKLQIETEIKNLEDMGNKSEDLDEYMDLLHKYNNAKDIAQCIMGELAIRSGTTLRQVAESIGAPTDDNE